MNITEVYDVLKLQKSMHSGRTSVESLEFFRIVCSNRSQRFSLLGALPHCASSCTAFRRFSPVPFSNTSQGVCVL